MCYHHLMQGVIAIIIATIVWGAGAPIFKYSLVDMPPFLLAFIRFFGAGILFLPLVYKFWPKKITPSIIWHLSLGAFWGISVNISFFFLGLQIAPSINSTIIGSIGPIMLYFLSLKFLKEKPHPELLKGILIAFLGVMIITIAPLLVYVQAKGVDEFSNYDIFLGNIYFIIATLGSVMIAIENKKISKKIHPIAMTGLQFLIGSLVFVPFVLGEIQNISVDDFTFRSWIGIIYGIFFSSALAYFANNYALTKMSASKIGMFHYVMPIASLLVAVPLLGEMPDVFFIVGSILVAIGVKKGSDPV